MSKSIEQSPELAAAIKKAGGYAALAAAIGLTRAAVFQWRRVPADRVIAVEAATGIPRARLRPDLYAPRRRKAA